MKESGAIVAINRDKGAPLAALAELTLVGDLYEVLPEVASQARQAKGEG
jgi:electron transfer flavoprotein alpha subunit